MAYTSRRQPRVGCLQDGRWLKLGGPRSAGGRPAFADNLLEIDGVLYLGRSEMRDARRVPGGGVDGKLDGRVYARAGASWRDVAGAPLFADGFGSLRNEAFDRAGQLCAGFDAVVSRGVALEVRVRCLDRGVWVDAAPPLTPRVSGRRVRSIDMDGGAAAGSDIYIGIDRFEIPPTDHRRRRDIDWPVLRLREGNYTPTSLGGTHPAWSEQGDLYRVGPEIWAMRFDQRPRNRTFAARIVVKALVPATGQVRMVGAPLLDDEDIYGPISTGLAVADVPYVLWTKPNRRTRRNELRVSRLGPPR